MIRPTSPALNFALWTGLAAFALAAFSPAIFNDGDTYWHIRAGEWMLDHRAVLRADVFSYTVNGAPWTAAEWLSEVVMALAWRAGGWTALHLLFGAAAGLTGAIVAGALRARLAMTAALLATVLGLSCITGSLLARPHMLALLLLALWTAELVRARQDDRAPRWWLVCVIPLWVNLHGSFAFGLALAAALGGEAVIEATDKKRAALGWGAFVLAATLSALLNPRGLDGLLFPLRLMAMGGLGHLGEWQPSDFSVIAPFEIALLAVVAVLALGRVRVPLPRLLLLLALAHLALAHGRHQMLIGVVGPLLLGSSLAQAWPRGEDQPSRIWPAAAIPALCALLLARLILPAARGDDPVTPAAALAHVPQYARAQPVLNDYAFGGYLIFRGVKPFIDSRADLYGDARLADYAAIIAPARGALAGTLARDRVRWTIFAANAPVVKAMDAMPGWHRLYGDAIAVVHIHD